MIKYIHQQGFKYGHYTDAGKSACNHDAPMSEGYEHQDATVFAEWGIDMIKIDSCGVQEGNETVTRRWAQELNSTGRPILFSNCHNGCVTPGFMGKNYSVGWADWCTSEANMWRTGSDIRPTWDSVMFNIHAQRGLGSHGGPGHWNDPDFLEIGLGPFKKVGPARAHFSMWCITSSPLIASLDLRKTNQDVLTVLTDSDAIAINQQYAGDAGDLLEEQGGQTQVCSPYSKQGCIDVGLGEVWYKPLPDGEAAVALLNNNKTGDAVHMNVSFAMLPSLASSGGACDVFDIWNKTSLRETEEITVAVEPMSVKLFRISNCQSGRDLDGVLV